MENREGGLEAVRHLIGLGHVRIATITGPQHSAAALDRRDGYKEALVEASLTIRPDLIAQGDFTQEGGRLAMHDPARAGRATHRGLRRQRHDGLRCAAGGSRAASVRVPEDLALVSFDDLPVASLLVPALTTVHQPLYDLGAAAADLLLKRLDRPETPPEHVWLPTTLVIRQSSGSPRLRTRRGPADAAPWTAGGII